MEFAFAVFEGRNGRLEVARVGEAVGADGAEFRQAEGQAVVLADISARLLLGKNDAELDAARNDADLAGRDFENSEFRVKAKRAELRDDQQLAIGGVEEAVLHGGVGGVDVNGDADLHGRIAVAAQRHDAVDEVGLLFGNRQRIPAELIGRGGNFEKWSAANELCGNLFVRAMRYGWANAIGPGAAIGGSRRGKRRAAELLGVEAERMLLRRVLALRQPAGNGLRGKFVSKAGLIPDLIGHALHLSQAVLHWRGARPRASLRRSGQSC